MRASSRLDAAPRASSAHEQPSAKCQGADLRPSPRPAPHSLCFSALYALIRYIRICLWANHGNPRVHAAARAFADCRRLAGTLADTVHRREMAPAQAPKISPGPTRSRQRHAHSGAPDRRHLPPRASLGKVTALGGPSVSACPRLLSRASIICMSAKWAMRPTI